jgi:mono/diheme cytochrome c family protein
MIRSLPLIGALVVLPAGVEAQAQDSLPPGVTPEVVTRGKSLYNGAGLCMACHGPTAKGMTGPDLTDSTLLHYDGSYEGLIKVVTTGIDDKASKTGQIMPAKGGSAMSDDEVMAVAAYVWTLRKQI